MDTRECDMEGCSGEATEIIAAESKSRCLSVRLCSFHYRYFRSNESLGKPINLKGIVVQERFN
jgi:hypothetical protein